MKRLYEGVSAATVVFFLIIVIGGFLFGTKSHKDSSRHRHKKEEIREKESEKYSDRSKEDYQRFEEDRDWYEKRQEEDKEIIDFYERANGNQYMREEPIIPEVPPSQRKKN